MSEFVEVMKELGRLCENYSCGLECPMYKECENIAQCATTDRYKIIEYIVITWAKEHPEPVYPTFREWLVDIGIINETDGDSDIADSLTLKRIPEKLAKKLAIKGEKKNERSE